MSQSQHRPEPDDRFADCTMDDFADVEFRATYLAHHNAAVYAPDPTDHVQNYSFSWPHGFMDCTPVDIGEDYATLWGCLFIYLWNYKKVTAQDADALVSRWVFGEWKANKNRQANPMSP